MKIAVCIKRTPDSESRFKIAASGSGIDETGLKFDIDDFASYAVEVALQLNEKQGSGRDGRGRRRAGRRAGDAAQGDEHGRRPRRAAQDRRGAVRWHSRSRRRSPPSSRAAATTSCCSASMRSIHRRASSAPRPRSCSASPCVTAATKLDIANGRGTARRELEGAAEMVEFALPAVVTIDEGIARPRYPSLKGIMAAKKKPLETKPAQVGDVRVTVEIDGAAAGPPGRPRSSAKDGGGARARAAAQTEAKVL